MDSLFSVSHLNFKITLEEELFKIKDKSDYVKMVRKHKYIWVDQHTVIHQFIEFCKELKNKSKDGTYRTVINLHDYPIWLKFKVKYDTNDMFYEGYEKVEDEVVNDFKQMTEDDVPIQFKNAYYKKMLSSNHLVKSCIYDLYPSEIPTLVDYFGNYISDDDNFAIIYGVYKGLVKYKGVDAELLHKCFIANRLDDLIHTKYKHMQTGYYKKFIDNKIKIGKTCLLTGIDNSFTINDDSYCPDYETQSGYLKYMACTKEV